MFSEDLTAFFTLDTPGSQTATVSGVDVVVLFDNGYMGALNGFVESSGPNCMARSSDVSSVAQGSTITIASVAYKVTNVQPDGFGCTTLYLEKA